MAPTVLDDRFKEDVKDEILASFDELTAEEVIPGLLRAIKVFSLQFPDPQRVLDEAVDILMAEEG